MGKLIDKVNLNMTFREVSSIVGNPHKVIVANHNRQRVIWQFFNSKGLLEIIFQEGKVHSKTIYLKGELLPDHLSQSMYGKTGSSESLTGGFSLNMSKEKLEEIQKQFNTWNSCPDQLRLKN